MRNKSCIITLCCSVFVMVLYSQALAHNLWLNPENYYPKVGTTVDIGIGWGHTYPANRVHQEMKDGRLEEIKAIDPDGVKVDLTKVSPDLYKLKIEKAGAYLVTAKIKPGFFTITPEGRKWGDKSSVENPVKCTNFHIEAKTALIAGGDERNLGSSAGQTVELIPVSNVKGLKKGDKLTVKVLFKGKPLSGIPIKATYAGFEAEDIAPHEPQQKGHGRHFPVETITDDRGQADMVVGKSGYWMALLSHKSPYPNSKTCDEYMYNITFTFEVQP